MKRNTKPDDNRLLLYVPRSMSQAMNAALDFMRQNWRVLFRYSLVLIVPVCVIQTVGLVTVVDEISAEVGGGFPFSNLMSLFLFGLLGLILLNAMLWSFVRLYHDRPDGLATMRAADFRPVFRRMLGRVSLAVLPMLIMWVALMSMAAVLFVMLPFAFFVFMLVSLPVFLVAPIYSLERISLPAAIGRAFSCGFRHFGDLIVMSITLVVCVAVMQALAMLPWGILLGMRELFGSSSAAGAELSPVGGILLNLSSVLLVYATYLSAAFVLLSAVYFYGSAIERSDGVSIAAQIEQFENL